MISRILVVLCSLVVLFSQTSFAQRRASREVTVNPGAYKPVGRSKNIFEAEEYFPNGNVKFRGRFITCTTRKNFTDYFEKRKTGTWTYYNPDGTPLRVENYTNATSCSTPVLKYGKWQYFNEHGELYFEEMYERDTVMNATVEIYKGNQLHSRILIDKGVATTKEPDPSTDDGNVIYNSGFEEYYYKPVVITNDGHDRIQDLIPYWSSSYGESPDYYNFNRKLGGVPAHFPDSTKADAHVGLMLYMRGTDNYSEHLRTRFKRPLQAGLQYCLTLNIMVSANAGFHADQIEMLLSGIQGSEEQKLIFSKGINSKDRWEKLCHCFVANGRETDLTLGVFSEPVVKEVRPRMESLLDINASAYYLIDNVELKPSSSLCSADDAEMRSDRGATRYHHLLDGKSVVINHLLFETDRSEINAESVDALRELSAFLKKNPQVNIKISGHTDNTGSEQHNHDLSLARAASVKKWLTDAGVNAARLSVIGLGSTSAVTDNLSEINRGLNRRVEISVVK